MKKVVALMLTSVVCLGCQSGGQRQTGLASASVPPAAPASNAVAGVPAANETAANETAENETAANGGGVAAVTGTIGRIWNAVGFQQPASAQPAPVSPEMARFNNFVGAIATQTSQLNVADPPEVTRQKAEAILGTLRDWDSVLAAGRSMGLLNDSTAGLLTRSVQRLTAETQKLVQYAPRPETIDAVKQLGGSLGAAYSGIQGILAQRGSVSQGLPSTSPQ